MSEYPITSVQSFYQFDEEPKQEASFTKLLSPGDGFTENELADILDPLHRNWSPEREYEEACIDQLVPGPRAVTFVGRIVNLKIVHGRCSKQPRASGYHNLIIKDDSGVISIKLYFARQPYPIKLGQLLTLWTAFISDIAKTDAVPVSSVLVHANMFPGRTISDHIMIHTSAATSSICRIPLQYQKGKSLPGLMTLDSYLSSGHDGVVSAKILVCVRSKGSTRKISRRDGGGESELIDVVLFDHTKEVRMTLWNEMIESSKEWRPRNTILLISHPGYKVAFSGKGTVSVLQKTLIEVDPDFPDAEWLRKYVVELAKRESLCVDFPEGVWNAETAENGVIRMLFTLAELDNWVRSDGHHVFTGFINVTIMEMSLVSCHRRNMLMCAECCGVPIYSNALTTPCKNCSKPLSLLLNPRIIGTLIDETGCIEQGKLLWSTRAWEALFGRSVEEVTRMTGEELCLFEQRVLFMRVHLVFGWEKSVGRLAVLGVMA